MMPWTGLSRAQTSTLLKQSEITLMDVGIYIFYIVICAKIYRYIIIAFMCPNMAIIMKKKPDSQRIYFQPSNISSICVCADKMCYLYLECSLVQRAMLYI